MGHLSSSLLLRCFACFDLSMPALGLGCFESSAFVLGGAEMEGALFAAGVAYFGLFLFLQHPSQSGSSSSAVDSVTMSFSLLLRSTSQVDLLPSAFGLACLDSALLALGSVQTGLPSSPRCESRTESSTFLLGLVHLGPFSLSQGVA